VHLTPVPFFDSSALSRRCPQFHINSLPLACLDVHLELAEALRPPAAGAVRTVTLPSPVDGIAAAPGTAAAPSPSGTSADGSAPTSPMARQPPVSPSCRTRGASVVVPTAGQLAGKVAEWLGLRSAQAAALVAAQRAAGCVMVPHSALSRAVPLAGMLARDRRDVPCSVALLL
jgi:hypothetical protein